MYDLKLINSEAGRFLLGIKDGFPIIKATDNSITKLIDIRGKNLIKQTDFYTFPRIKKIFGTIEAKMEIANEYKRLTNRYEAFLHFTGLQEQRNKYPQIYLTVSTFTGAAGEGVIFNSDSSFANARAAASGDTTLLFATQVQTTTTGWQIARTFLPFDTSALPDTDDISASKVTLYRDDSVNTFGNTDTTSIELVVSTQPDPAALTNADYDLVSFTSKGSFALASTTNNTAFDLTISDFTIISKTGHTLLACLTGRDQGNSAPTGDNTLGFQDNADANPPTLSVTHAAPAPGGNPGKRSLLGVGI